MSSENLQDYETRPIPALIEDPLLEDHRWLIAEMGRLIGLAGGVEKRFAHHAAVPRGLREHLASMREGLARHIDTEERLIFPAIVSGNPDDVRGAIRDLERDHLASANALEKIRAMSGDLDPPDEADRDWTDLYASLERVEARIHRHIEVEDRILFPRVFFEQPDSPDAGSGR